MPLNSSQHSTEIKNHYNSACTLFLITETNYIRISSNLKYTIFSELILLSHHENSRLEMTQKLICSTK